MVRYRKKVIIRDWILFGRMTIVWRTFGRGYVKKEKKGKRSIVGMFETSNKIHIHMYGMFMGCCSFLANITGLRPFCYINQIKNTKKKDFEAEQKMLSFIISHQL